MLNLLFFNKAGYKQNIYDEIISLGYNCEVNYRLKDFFSGHVNPFLFSWAFVIDRYNLIKALNNLDTFANSDYHVLPWNMVLNEKYNISFHSRYTDIYGSNNDYIKKALNELKSRLTHLAEKTNEVLKSSKNILLVLKLDYTELKDDIKYIKNLNSTLQNLHKNGSYKLLVVFNKNDIPINKLEEMKNISIENVFIETVSEFSNTTKTPMTGDIIGWYKILKKHIKKS